MAAFQAKSSLSYVKQI